MCLLKNQLPNISILWNTYTLLKPDSSMFILMEPICFSLAHSLLYLINFCITLLGFDDPLQQVWFHLQCFHKSLRTISSLRFLNCSHNSGGIPSALVTLTWLLRLNTSATTLALPG